MNKKKESNVLMKINLEAFNVQVVMKALTTIGITATSGKNKK